MRQQGKSEATIAAVLGAMGRIHKPAARRLGFSGMNPITLMLSSERPRSRWPRAGRSSRPRRSSRRWPPPPSPTAPLFTVAALTGASVPNCAGSRGRTSVSTTWTTLRSRSRGRSIGREAGGPPRTTAPLGRYRSHESWRWYSRGTSSLLATRDLKRSYSPRAQGVPCPSGTSPGHCVKHSSAPRTSTGSRPSRPPRGCRGTRRRRALDAFVPSHGRRPGRSSPARAWTKSPSYWDTATPRSPGLSTSTRSPTPVAGTCVARG